MISWRALLPEDDRIGTAELLARVPEVDWDRLYTPELQLAASTAHRLERVWLTPHPSAGAGSARKVASRRLDERVVTDRFDHARLSRSAAAL